MTRSRPGAAPLYAATVLAALLLVALGPRPAYACSCAMQEPEAAVAQAEAGFVGTLVDRDGDRWVFDVEAVVAGDLSTPLSVRVESGDSSSCGIQPEPGRRYGLLAYHEPDGVLASNLCLEFGPDDLLAAGEPRAPSASGESAGGQEPAGASSGEGAGLAIVAAVVLGSLAVLGAAVFWSRRRPTDG